MNREISSAPGSVSSPFPLTITRSSAMSSQHVSDVLARAQTSHRGAWPLRRHHRAHPVAGPLSFRLVPSSSLPSSKCPSPTCFSRRPDQSLAVAGEYFSLTRVLLMSLTPRRRGRATELQPKQVLLRLFVFRCALQILWNSPSSLFSPLEPEDEDLRKSRQGRVARRCTFASWAKWQVSVFQMSP